MATQRAWQHIGSLGSPAELANEQWISPQGQAHEVRVRFGKKLDVFDLKRQTFDRFATQVAEIKASRLAMYAPENLEPVRGCPVCSSPTELNRTLMEVYGATYCKCESCSHVYV